MLRALIIFGLLFISPLAALAALIIFGVLFLRNELKKEHEEWERIQQRIQDYKDTMEDLNDA